MREIRLSSGDSKHPSYRNPPVKAAKSVVIEHSLKAQNALRILPITQ